MNIIRVFILVTLVKLICAKDDHTINFIRDFIENERKPTHLILNDLCWPKHIKVKLTKKLSKDGCRVSSSTNTLHECQKHGIMFLLDLDCPQSEDAIEIASSRNLFGSPYRWLILSTNPEQLESSVLWESPVLPDSDLVLAEKSENGYKLTELHKTSKNMSMISSPRGYYNGTLVDVRTHREIFRRRRNLMGAPLTMSNVIQDSNKTMYHLPREDRLDLQNDVIAKTSWMNARLAFQMLNATARYIFSHRWGYKQNGQWSGMINDLHTGRADVGTNCLGTMTDRFEVILYTDTLARYRVAFILRQPPLSYVSNIFSLPFSTSVWIAIALCSCLSMFALYFTSKWEVRKGKTETQLDGTMGDAFLLTMSAISQQGCVIEPRRLSGRIIVWIFFAVLMALYAAYSANIVVLLQAPSNSIKNLAQLVSSKLTLAAYDVDYSQFIFKLYNDSLHMAVYKKIKPEKSNGLLYEMNEGVEKIRQGLFAFHSITEPVYRRIEQTFLEGEKCDLVEIDYLNAFDPFTPVKKDSPYLELMRVVFKQLAESGIRTAIHKRMFIPKPHCSTKMAAFSSVGMMDLKPVLLLMVYGAVLSLAILVLEMVHYRLYTTRKRERKTKKSKYIY
ncbi:ionotropic receptor 75a isoform X1 [Galleria mellonella]|uniref:Ionotropic receptor 75a isoform X1 n=1 Tax=Galleria mellonella TaxID=7137 RepID=A0A5C0E2N3_GALME|nr:ionotropic receptor 75a isoform X1 [Galleria mellonella]QEI46871.1 ionotropic receptor 75p.1 [Galleria mellonella]